MKGYSKWTRETVKAVFDKSSGRCWYCGKALSIDSRYATVTRDSFAIDHFIPIHAGGPDTIDNLVPACCACNCQNGRHDIEHMRDQCTRRDAGCPPFNRAQIAYLKRRGFDLMALPRHVFWFEKNEVFPYVR